MKSRMEGPGVRGLSVTKIEMKKVTGREKEVIWKSPFRLVAVDCARATDFSSQRKDAAVEKRRKMLLSFFFSGSCICCTQLKAQDPAF